MLASHALLLALALLGLRPQPARCSRVLAVFPTVSKSHFDFFEPLLEALAARGHQVTVVNSHPRPRPVGNYTDISLREFKNVFFNNIPFADFPRIPIAFPENHGFLLSQISENEPIFSHPDVQRLLDSPRHRFDLVLVEMWNTDLFLGFGHRFKAPVIALSSSSALPWANARFGNPDNPAYIPNIFLPLMGRLDFFQRLTNTAQVVASKLAYRWLYDSRSEALARRVFGADLPPLAQLAQNVSLLLVNTHHTLHGIRPTTPQVVHVGGIHVRPPSPLPKVAYANLYHRLVLSKISDEAAGRHFGQGTPTSQLAEAASLLLVNSHFSLLPSAAPYPPSVVEVGGIHVMEPKRLSTELDKWMNESSKGVVYFSFGSMLRGATLPVEKVKAFLTVFGSLPQRVLWKWEDDAVDADRLPANVKIMKWLPQRDVLAHPKVRAFISHGGLLGTTEAVVSGVPILGIPMYGDQPNNVAALVERGVAVHVDYNNISVASLSYALDALLNDKRYSENAKQLSVRFLDRPMSPLDTAVYWTEYVIRHRGAPHLQSAAVHLAWYQYYLLDVAAVFLLAIFLTLAVVYYILRSCLRLVVPASSSKLKTN